MENTCHHHQESSVSNDLSWQAYRPLWLILAVITLTAVALSAQTGQTHHFMRYFMGLFLLQFALFKMFDLSAFVDGFSHYDLLAKRWKFYARSYPFIELSLGLLYLSGFWLLPVNIATAIIMVIGAAGIVCALATGNHHLKCACLGQALNVPLGIVSALENVAMAGMAIWMLLG